MGCWFQLSYETTPSFTVVETMTAMFTRINLTLVDAPLVSINCTSNCGSKMHFVLGDMVLDVSYSVVVSHCLNKRKIKDFFTLFCSCQILRNHSLGYDKGYHFVKIA